MNLYELNRYLSAVTLTMPQLFPERVPDFNLYSVADLLEYKDNKPTEKVIGQRFYTVDPKDEYKKYVIKVKCDKPLITMEQIQQKGGLIKINFKNLAGKIYRKNENIYEFSYSADGIEVVQ